MPVHSHGYPAFVARMEGSECASAEDTDADQLPTAHCTAGKQHGGRWVFAMAKADRMAADDLWKKCHRAEESSQEHATQLQSLRSYKAQWLCNFYIVVAIIAD